MTPSVKRQLALVGVLLMVIPGAVACAVGSFSDAYQISDEPNLGRERGNRPLNPVEYTQLLKVAYQSIKAVDSNAYVISAGLAPTTRCDNIAMPDTVFSQYCLLVHGI